MNAQKGVIVPKYVSPNVRMVLRCRHAAFVSVTSLLRLGLAHLTLRFGGPGRSSSVWKQPGGPEPLLLYAHVRLHVRQGYLPSASADGL